MTSIANILVNGTPFAARDGEPLLSALERAGIHLPSVCSDERLKPCGECRLCSVEIAGQTWPVTSCQRRVSDGMEVQTHTEALETFRRQMLEWLAQHCDADSMERFPDKVLHRELKRYGITPPAQPAPAAQVDASHPYIRVDMSKCITCYRCVRICEEVQGQSVWHVIGRGDQVQIVPDSGTTLAASSCVSCGACVDTCPTAALIDVRSLDQSPPQQWTRTVCAYCGVGCELEAGTADNEIVAMRPALDAPVNKGHACVKGRYAYEFLRSPQRITQPMLRRDSEWQAVSWKEALDFTAAKLQEIILRHGPDSIGVLGSARGTNEEAYLAQKFARIAIGTNNIDCCARVCHTPTAAAMKAMLGAGAATNSFDDIEAARLFLIVGANPSENHPVVGARIKQQLLRGDAQAIVIDPRRTELAGHARIHLALRPGTNVPLLNAMARVILTENLFDQDFVSQRVDNLEALRLQLRPWTPERAAEICGVSVDDIYTAARLYAAAKPAMCFHGLGVTEHTQGTEGVMCVVNLALLTGNLGKTGSGVNPLRGQNNVQGAAHMGCDPSILTGSVSIKNAREHFAAHWDSSISTVHGLNLMTMMDAAQAGTLKALYVIGYDVYLTLANAAETRKALEKLELVIVQDLFLNETAVHFGTVFLPAAATYEKDGTFMNSERRVQRVRRVVDAPGGCKADWEIICELGRRLGKPEQFAFLSPAAIWDEVRALWPDGAGMSYARLERGGLQWPCRTEQDPGTSLLHVTAFSAGEVASLRAVEFHPTSEMTDEAYPILLTTGRSLYQFNAGTMSGYGGTLALRPVDTLDLAPADADRLNLANGALARVTSRHGKVELPVRVLSSIQPGQAFATFHNAASFLNELTSSCRDSIVQAPEYKVTAVHVQLAAPHQNDSQADLAVTRAPYDNPA